MLTLTLDSHCINNPREAYRVVNELRRAVINGIDNCGSDYDSVKFSCHVYDILTYVCEPLKEMIHSAKAGGQVA